MGGQWIGTYAGTNSGNITLNLDHIKSGYSGVAYLIDSNSSLPSIGAIIDIDNTTGAFETTSNLILPINPSTGTIDSWANVGPRYENVEFPSSALVEGEFDGDQLSLQWSTDIGTVSSGTLRKSRADLPSTLAPKQLSWSEFKAHVSTLEGDRHIFRGQSKPWKLRTSFHRTGRADLHRFITVDIPALNRRLSASTQHVFDLSVGDQNGSFFNLVQHHGYPTPLLDWSFSPYVAAFFAFRGISNSKAKAAGDDEFVRIHSFDQALWKEHWAQLNQVLMAGPHLSVAEFMAIENKRMIPQQAISTITNMDDIEEYILSKNPEVTYLSALDIPISSRPEVVRELTYMGITAGALFPGLDGACEELKERYFDL